MMNSKLSSTALTLDTSFIKGALYALLCALSYALNPIMMKFGYQTGLTAITILQGRFITACLCMGIFLYFYSKKDLRPNKSLIVKAFILAVAIMFPMNLLYAEALKTIPASVSTLVTYMYPVVVILVCALFMSQKIRFGNIISIVFVICGSLCIFSNAITENIDGYGLIICVVGMLFYAAYILIIQKFIRNESPFSLTFYTLAFTAVIYAFTKNPVELIHLNLKQSFICFIYGFICTICTTIFLFKAIEKIGPVETSIFCSFEPAFTVIFSFLLLAEEMFLLRVIGLLFLITGIVLPNLSKLLSSKSNKIKFTQEN